MAASNCGGFSWTEEKSCIILDIMTHLVISKKLDPLADGTIEMVLSKVVEFKDFTLFRGITTQDVKGHLIERRKIYMRVCELANHPNIIGFLQSTCNAVHEPRTRKERKGKSRGSSSNAAPPTAPPSVNWDDDLDDFMT